MVAVDEILEILEVAETDESALTDIQVESSALDDLTGEAARARDALAAAALPVQEAATPAPSEPIFPEREPVGEWTPPVVTDPMDMAIADLAPAEALVYYALTSEAPHFGKLVVGGDDPSLVADDEDHLVSGHR